MARITQVRMTRYAVDQSLQFLQWAQSHELKLAELEDPEKCANLVRFKYWAGRNLDTMLRIHEKTGELIDACGYPEPRREGEPLAAWRERADAFDRTIGARSKLLGRLTVERLEELAERNGQGQIVYRDESKLPKLSPENQAIFDQWRADTERTEFIDIMEWKDERQRAQSAVLDAEITVPVFVYPFALVSAGISGSILSGIRFMLSGAPEEEWGGGCESPGSANPMASPHVFPDTAP